jgi:serine/threonine protein kinase
MRAPEECRYENLDEKADVYRMGNILYVLLSGGKLPWKGVKDSKKGLCAGKSAPLPKRLAKANVTKWSKSDQILKTAIDMCHVFDPVKRSSATDVWHYLQQQLIKS